MNQVRIKLGEIFGAFEEQIGGILALSGAPIVTEIGHRARNLPVKRVRFLKQGIECLRPVSMHLRVSKAM